MFLMKEVEEVIYKNRVHQPKCHLVAMYFIVTIADEQK